MKRRIIVEIEDTCDQCTLSAGGFCHQFQDYLAPRYDGAGPLANFVGFARLPECIEAEEELAELEKRAARANDLGRRLVSNLGFFSGWIDAPPQSTDHLVGAFYKWSPLPSSRTYGAVTDDPRLKPGDRVYVESSDYPPRLRYFDGANHEITFPRPEDFEQTKEANRVEKS